jgi:hypothetical protein
MANYTEVRTPRTLSTLSDNALIGAFIDGFFQGQTVLLSNQTLRTEPILNSMQLLSLKEGCIATANLNATPISMMVRYGSSYGSLIHERLIAQSFYPLVGTGQEASYLYQFCEAPEGYDLFCTTAKDLWRACWGRGLGHRPGIPMDLLIWRQGPPGSKDAWYSLRGMDCDRGQLTVKMLGWSNAVNGSDLVLWARQEMSYQPGQRSVSQSETPRKLGTSGRLPFRQ